MGGGNLPKQCHDHLLGPSARPRRGTGPSQAGPNSAASRPFSAATFRAGPPLTVGAGATDEPISAETLANRAAPQGRGLDKVLTVVKPAGAGPTVDRHGAAVWYGVPAERHGPRVFCRVSRENELVLVFDFTARETYLNKYDCA